MKVLLLVLLLAGCSAPSTSPYAGEQPSAVRDSERARELNLQAADLMTQDPVRAEALLREALAADLFFGPAHNNLGILHLQAGRLYEAAHEFEWARKLLPGHPDPRLNLAIALDRAGRTADSTEAFEAALEIAPGYVPAMQGLALLSIREGVADERVPAWLRRIVMEGESPRWRAWAEKQLASIER